MGSKIEKFAKISIFYHHKNAVFGSFWFLNTSGHQIFFVICVEETIWNRSIHRLYRFSGDPDILIRIYNTCAYVHIALKRQKTLNNWSKLTSFVFKSYFWISNTVTSRLHIHWYTWSASISENRKLSNFPVLNKFEYVFCNFLYQN